MLSHEIPAEVSKVIDLASNDIYRDQDSPTWSPYSCGEQLLTVWAIEQAQGIIDNGGFQYFFENDWPEKPPYSIFVDAFRRIGANEAADCIDNAVKMFPSSDPHLDYQMRRDYMESLREKNDTQESLVDELGNRVIDLGGDTCVRLARYILTHANSFPTVRSAEQGNSGNSHGSSPLTEV